MEPTPIVIKVGGSLFDVPTLGPDLARWLNARNEPSVLLLPGGGPTANVIRGLDREHGLGEEQAHWLALRALTLNAHFLAGIVPHACVIEHWQDCRASWRARRIPIVDAFAFARADEGQPGSLPHRWDATSDSLAVRVAVVSQARQLILLKSVGIPEECDWREASRRNWVDPCFPSLLPGDLPVSAINFRAAIVSQ